MKILSYISFFSYIIFLILNLYNKYIDKKVETAFFKALLMPVLLIFYLSSFRNFTFFILLALILSWLGDLFLIKTNKRNMIFGIISFSITHILYIATIIKFIDFKNINYIFLSILIVFYFGIAIFLSFFLIEYAHKLLRQYTNIIFLYSLLLSTLAITSVLAGLNSKFLTGFYLILGSNLFMVSDSVLSYNLFVKRDKFTDILIMFTYAIAQLLIILGFGNLI